MNLQRNFQVREVFTNYSIINRVRQTKQKKKKYITVESLIIIQKNSGKNEKYKEITKIQ